jgi:putative tryptophan/tyrosine transport system substrate-binding protein
MLLGSAAIASPLSARAQQHPVKMPRIGFLGLGPASVFASRVDALRDGLRDLGYIEGKNIVFEFRWADSVDQLPQLAAELVRMTGIVLLAFAIVLLLFRRGFGFDIANPFHWFW